MTQNLINHLDRQLRFLEHSCWLYDLGFRDEGIRIATVIRVLIHDTKKSTSLLRQLNSDRIDILDTSRVLPDPLFEAFHGLAIRTLTSQGVSLAPNFNRTSNATGKPVPAWWNQVVCASTTLVLTRRKIVWAAANKDGGAHVDDLKQEDEYAKLAAPGYFDQVTDLGGPFIDAHLVALRQMGYELLNSRALVQLAASAAPLPKGIQDFPPPSSFRMTL